MHLLMRYRDLVLPLGIIGCLVVILVPLPPALMDLLLAANITISVIVLLTTVYVASPLEFSIFPSLLLATTLARRLYRVTSYLGDLQTQFADERGSLGLVPEVLGDLLTDPVDDVDAGSERETDSPY